MPTGYTACIGRGVSFEEFASRCARAGMPLVSLRDEPMDAPLPDEIKPSSYHAEQVEYHKKQIAIVEAMSDADAELTARQEAESKAASHARYYADKVNLRKSYKLMLAQVNEWEPPTPDHEFLKKFMCAQLEESIRFDCAAEFFDRPAEVAEEPIPGAEWKARRLKGLRGNLEYHTAEHAKDVAHAAWATEWLRAFKASLRKEVGK